MGYRWCALCTATPESQAPPFFGNSLPKALLPPDSCVLRCGENFWTSTAISRFTSFSAEASQLWKCPSFHRHCEPVRTLVWQSASPKAVAIAEPFKISLSRPSPMGKVAALVLTEEEKTQDFPPSRLVLLSTRFYTIPLPPTVVGTFPSGKVFESLKRRMNNRNHPTSEFAQRSGERIATPVCALVRNDGGKSSSYATTRLPSLQNVGYSMSVMSLLQFVQYA